MLSEQWMWRDWFPSVHVNDIQKQACNLYCENENEKIVQQRTKKTNKQTNENPHHLWNNNFKI